MTVPLRGFWSNGTFIDPELLLEPATAASAEPGELVVHVELEKIA
jgi:hypothetical protein